MLEREWEGECVDFRKSVRMLGGMAGGFFFGYGRDGICEVLSGVRGKVVGM